MAVLNINKVMNENSEWSSLSMNIEITPYDDEEKILLMFDGLKKQVSKLLKKENHFHQSSVEN